MNMRTLSPEDYWSAVVSRKWLVSSVTPVSLTIAGVVCALMPKMYQLSTKMWVEGAKISESIVSGPNSSGVTYAPTLDDRVMEVRQFVMGRERWDELPESLACLDMKKIIRIQRDQKMPFEVCGDVSRLTLQKTSYSSLCHFRMKTPL